MEATGGCQCSFCTACCRLLLLAFCMIKKTPQQHLPQGAPSLRGTFTLFIQRRVSKLKTSLETSRSFLYCFENAVFMSDSVRPGILWRTKMANQDKEAKKEKAIKTMKVTVIFIVIFVNSVQAFLDILQCYWPARDSWVWDRRPLTHPTAIPYVLLCCVRTWQLFSEQLACAWYVINASVTTRNQTAQTAENLELGNTFSPQDGVTSLIEGESSGEENPS